MTSQPATLGPPARLHVAAIRYTDQVPAMQAFLETIGLSTAVRSARAGWADLRAGAGRVWLHSAVGSDSGAGPGETRLSFEYDGDIADLTGRLATAGLTAEYVDEAYGRSMNVVDPLGDTLVINEHSADTYGYLATEPQPDARLTVSPVRFTDPLGPYAEFLVTLGLRLSGEASSAYASYDSGDGLVGLHHDDGNAAVLPGPGAVHLSLSTTEDLDALAGRLQAAGYDDARVERDEYVSLVAVTRPRRPPRADPRRLARSSAHTHECAHPAKGSRPGRATLAHCGG